MRRLLLSAIVVLGVLGACGDDDDTTPDDGAPVADDAGATGDDATDDGDGDDDGAADDAPPPASSGDPVGTVTIAGTEYTLIASVQCLVAIEEANQISISGDVEGYESDNPVEWAYSWDADDGINEFRIDVSDDLEYRDFGDAALSEPDVDGRAVRASGTLVASGTTDPVDASFSIDCGA